MKYLDLVVTFKVKGGEPDPNDEYLRTEDEILQALGSLGAYTIDHA